MQEIDSEERVKSRHMIPGIYPIRGLLGSCHLLVDDDEVVLLDTGMIGEIPRIEKLLHEHGFDLQSLRAILLTHGHLDHVGNLTKLVELSGAPVYAHQGEQAHIDGRFPYQSWSRGCGWMEAIGRGAFHYRSTPITHFLKDEDELPFWGGLKVKHLPGHTEGHCGFYSTRHNLLFSGDLFASYWFNTHQPPPFLNSCPDQFLSSLRRVLALNPSLILPNHYDHPDPQLHADRFRKLTRHLTI